MKKMHYGGAYIKNIECPIWIQEAWAYRREYEKRKKENPTFYFDKGVRFKNPKPKESSDVHKVNCMECFVALNELIVKLIQSGGVK